MKKRKQHWPVKRSSLLDATGQPLTSQNLDQVGLIDPLKLPAAHCMVKAPNGDKELFANFAVYGINPDGNMAMVYCELSDLGLAIHELNRMFERGIEDYSQEERNRLYQEIELKQEEMDAIRAVSEQSSREGSNLVTTD